MSSKYLKQNIDRLDIPTKAIDLLKENGIKQIEQLCNKTKTYLKNVGLTSYETNKIEIELQLLGLNLRTNC